MFSKHSVIFRLSVGLALFVALISSAFAQAAVPQGIDPTTIIGVLKGSMATGVSKLTAHALSWLGAFATLQFFITNYKLLTSDGDLQAAVAKLVSSVAWVGIVVFVIQNGPSFLSTVGDSFYTLVGFDMPSTGAVVKYTVTGFGSLAAVAGAVGVLSNTIGFLLVVFAVGLLAVGMYFAFKIFMLQLELAMIVMLSPLSFAFLGLNTLRDQGIAPFKSLLSLAYRIILVTVILGAFGEVSNVLGSYLNSLGKEAFFTNAADTVEGLGAAAGAYLLLGFLIFKSDSVAASLASGSTSMGTADVASAAAAGAAMGAGIVSGGAVAAGAGTAVPKSMRSFMGSLGGGGGTVRNAAATGSGPAPVPSSSAPSGATMSMANGSPGSTGGGGPSSAMRGSETGDSPGSMSGSSSSAAAEGGGVNAGASSGFSVPSSATESSPQDIARGASSTVPKDIATGRIGPNLSGSDSPARQGGPGAAEPQLGSGRNAGIAGDQSREIADSLGKVADLLAKQGEVRKPRKRDRLAEANRHMERESANVSVSISPHHTD
jgi:type IV secretion system protein TrbL